MVFVRRPFFHYDPARCGMPTLYGTVSERAAKTIRFNTLWQWKGYETENETTAAILVLSILLNRSYFQLNASRPGIYRFLESASPLAFSVFMCDPMA